MTTFKHIYRAGVEIEGAWEFRHPHIHHDGSVRIGHGYEGEISSDPFTNPEDIQQWLIRNYPKHVNDTCGLHVHVSFRTPAVYQMIMDRRFFDFYKRRYAVWIRDTHFSDKERIWVTMRFGGINRYCVGNFIPDKQCHSFGGRNPNRYTMLNYCWSHHGTLESRLLPMFEDTKVAWSGIKEYLDMVETWIEEHKDELETDLATINLEQDNSQSPIIEPTERIVIAAEPIVITADELDEPGSIAALRRSLRRVRIMPARPAPAVISFEELAMLQQPPPDPIIDDDLNPEPET